MTTHEHPPLTSPQDIPVEGGDVFGALQRRDDLSALEGLRLDDNSLSGVIPTEVIAMMTRLADLTLGSNHFTEAVPPDRIPPPDTWPP